MPRPLLVALLAAALAAVALFALGLVLFGAGSEVAGGVDGVTLVDERSGEYRGVRMGDSSDEVRRRLGEDAGGSGFAPAGTSPVDAAVPESVPAPGGVPPGLLKYDEVAFLLGPRGVYSFIVTDEGARTRRGVGVGDELELARGRYRLRCRDVAGGESILGGGISTYPSCWATLGGVRLFFGGDPIRSVTLLSLDQVRPR